MHCSKCGFAANQPSPFCPACGWQAGLTVAPGFPQQGQTIQQAYPYAHHVARSRGFGQLFGIHPMVAFLTVIVDMMLFDGEVLTMGALLPLSIGTGFVLGIIAYLAQRKWYGDDKESALIKALAIGVLTAIPTPLPAALYIPSGIVGLIHKWRNK